MALNPKQQRFCEEYIIDLNGTQAAIRDEYSEKTAGSQAEHLLRSVEVQRYVQSLMNERVERTEITDDYVLSTITETIERCRQNTRRTDPYAGQDHYLAYGQGGI